MGPGIIWVGNSATALVWTLGAFFFIWLYRFLSSNKRIGWLAWVLAIIVASCLHGLVMTLFPAYNHLPLGGAASLARIFVVPPVLLLILIFVLGQFFKHSSTDSK